MLGTSGSKLEIAVHSAPELAEDNYAPRWIEALESLGAKVRICDFRTPDIIDWDTEQIPEKALRIARALSRDCGFQSMAYDFLFDSVGELRVSEISYGFVNHLVFKCPGHWDRDLVWHSGQIWPERAQAEGFLCKIRKIQGA